MFLMKRHICRLINVFNILLNLHLIFWRYLWSKHSSHRADTQELRDQRLMSVCSLGLAPWQCWCCRYLHNWKAEENEKEEEKGWGWVLWWCHFAAKAFSSTADFGTATLQGKLSPTLRTSEQPNRLFQRNCNCMRMQTSLNVTSVTRSKCRIFSAK